ncbi:MAG: DMT family transporter [Pseudomonadota bacterium]|nr:DMT family transporter [Pseudomonadota bacterium]
MRTSEIPSAEPASVWPAIAQVLVGVLLFSVSDTMAKYLRQSLPAIEIAWLRYVVFVLFGVTLAGRRRFAGLWPRRPSLQVLRGVTLLGSAVLFITGLSHLQMAEASAISFVSPAFITALSVLFLREQVGVYRWTATLVGLIGVLVVIRPGIGALQLAALYPLSSAACWAVAMIATRLIGPTERGETTLLWSAGVGLAILTVLLPFAFVPPRWSEAGLGICLGITASSGQYLLILAYRRATASVLAPFSYLQLLASAALGYAVFGSVPDPLAFVGAAIIIGSGLYIVYRERVRARAGPARP